MGDRDRLQARVGGGAGEGLEGGLVCQADVAVGVFADRQVCEVDAVAVEVQRVGGIADQRERGGGRVLGVGGDVGFGEDLDAESVDRVLFGWLWSRRRGAEQDQALGRQRRPSSSSTSCGTAPGRPRR